jgi:hypothetical protein
MRTGRAEPLDLDSIRRRRSDILRLTERYGASNVRVLGSVAGRKDRIRPRVLAEAVPL